MPIYEMTLLFRIMTRPELKEALARCGKYLFDEGAVIRKIENLGTRKCPYKIRSYFQKETEASYFLFTSDVSRDSIYQLRGAFIRDIDIIRGSIRMTEEHKPFECTAENEALPVPYRDTTKKMLDPRNAKRPRPTKPNKPKWGFNTGLKYYPFQR